LRHTTCFRWIHRDGGSMHCDWRSESFVHMAAKSHDFVTLDMLLEKGANINENTKTELPLTPLHFTLYGMDDDPCYIEEMLKRGANVGTHNLLFMLVKENLKECMQLVVDRHGYNINEKNRDGRTPVHYFFELGNVGIWQGVAMDSLKYH
jgi:ankyrin repeat protein